ncbi:unnamed protein product [Victoria cruziana]
MGKKGRAIVVGGSVAGLSCAHALMQAGCEVVVLEKVRRPSGSATGAGLGLDPQSCRFLSRWLGDPNILVRSTLPLNIDQNQATDNQNRTTIPIARDEKFNFRAAYWNDLHGLLYNALPKGTVFWGHQFLAYQPAHDNSSVKVQARIVESGNTVEIVGDLLVAADGSMSIIRHLLLPDCKLRYSGYCAWRGVLDFSQAEFSRTMKGVQKAYPDLGNCLYFDIALGSHCVLYELQRERLNWLWYINQPEPELKGSSLTMSISNELLKNMHAEAEKVWVPELAEVMKATADPFINVIYDCDPLTKLHWDNVVLVGDAAHPTSPHGLRSTNMSIVDAATLGQCIEKYGMSNLNRALEEYEKYRLPVISQQVLHSRKLGRLKQGLDYKGHGKNLHWKDASREDCMVLLQRNMPFFAGTPMPADPEAISLHDDIS